MILAGFDNINVSLNLPPRELKVLFHALEHIGLQEQAKIAEEMRSKGYKDYGSKEVFAILRQMELVIGPFVRSIHRIEQAEENEDSSATIQ